MRTLAFISVLGAGWLVAGLAACAIPVLAHLLARRRGAVVSFPAARFVRAVLAERARRRRVRDLALLALRTALIALVAVAFARPLWMDAAPASDAERGQDVVIVLDASASMTRADGGRPIFDRARDEARAILLALDPARDRAGVLLAALAPRAALPALTNNMPPLIGALDRARPTLERADLGAAIAAAAALPALDAPDGGRPRRIVVLSDMQRTGWADVTAPELPAGVRVTVRPVGPTDATPNIGIIRAQVTPARPAVGGVASITATVANFGDASAAPRITLDLDGRPESRTLRLAPGERADVAFAVTFAREGEATASLRLDADAFTPDDRRWLAFEVARARRVAVITACDAGDLSTGAHYLRVALDPDGASALRPVIMRPDAIALGALGGCDAAVVVGAGAIDEAVLAPLTAWVKGGGGLVWVVDSPESERSLEQFAAGTGAGAALPVRLSGRFSVAERPIALRAPDGPTSPLAGLDGGAARALLASTFTAIAPSEAVRNGVVAAAFDNGDPFIASGPFGAGRLALVLADLAPARSSLARSPIFPVVVHELIAAVAPERPGSPTAEVGVPITLVRAASGFTPPLTDALGRRAGATPVGGVLVISAPGAPEPGLVPITDAAASLVATAAVAIDARESDLRPADPDEVRRVVGAAGDGPAPPDRDWATAAELVGRARAIELWPLLLACAVVIAAVESLVASGRTRRARAPAVAP